MISHLRVRNRVRTAGGIPASRTAYDMTKAFRQLTFPQPLSATGSGRENAHGPSDELFLFVEEGLYQPCRFGGGVF